MDADDDDERESSVRLEAAKDVIRERLNARSRDELRERLLVSALEGLASGNEPLESFESVVRRAIALANETLRQLDTAE